MKKSTSRKTDTALTTILSAAADQTRSPDRSAATLPTDIHQEFASRYVPEHEAAKLLRVKVQTMRLWSAYRRGPHGRVRVGRDIFYSREGLFQFLASREQAASVE